MIATEEEEEKDKADNGLKVETFSEIAQVLPREATLHPWNK